ncbi:flagellar hook-length control protein FliK [Leptospira sp. WS92.C1]
MNISSDLTVSEFRIKQNVPASGDPTPNVSLLSGFGLTGKNSFLDLMKSLQGSAQKGLDETLTGIQNAFSKSEVPEAKETQESKDKKIESEEPIESEDSEVVREEDEIEDLEEISKTAVLPWFLVADAKSDEAIDAELESKILNELEATISEESFFTTTESNPLSTTEFIQSLFSKEEAADLRKELNLKKESETSSSSFGMAEESSELFSKETKIKTGKKEVSSVSTETKSSELSESVSFSQESNTKELKENVKNSSIKEAAFKTPDEGKTEVSKEIAADSEKWKISRDKKTDSYLNLKSSSREEIKIAVLNQFSENSSGKSGQEQSSRGGSDSYSSLAKGLGSPVVVGREVAISSSQKEFSTSKESSILSKKDIQQNFQNLIRSARVQILDNGKTEASIRMNPKDLGQMSLSISTDKDIVRGKLMVESDSVKQQLTAELANLKQELKANGLELESLVIEVREREEAFAFNSDSEKHKQDSHSFQTAFGEDWDSDFKNSSWEEDELSLEENFSEPHGFSEKTEGKTEKLLDLKV